MYLINVVSCGVVDMTCRQLICLSSDMDTLSYHEVRSLTNPTLQSPSPSPRSSDKKKIYIYLPTHVYGTINSTFSSSRPDILYHIQRCQTCNVNTPTPSPMMRKLRLLQKTIMPVMSAGQESSSAPVSSMAALDVVPIA